MRILFVDPPRANMGRARTTSVRIPDLALGYLSAIAEAHGHDIAVIDSDSENMSHDECVSSINKFAPQIVCMTVFTYKLKSAQRLASSVKKSAGAPKTIVGGVHPTVAAEETLNGCDDFDYCVNGEGEQTLIELLERIESGSAPSDVKGVTWRDGQKTVVNESRERTENLDALPFPDWSKFNLKRYDSLYAGASVTELSALTSRGCVGGCSFCYRMQGGRIRYRSVENVIEEIILDLDKYGAESLVFMDQVFTANPERARIICHEMIKNRVAERASWVCQTRADLIDMETMKMLKSAGCTHISCGIESGSEDVLGKNGKKLKLPLVRESLFIAKKAGLTVDTNYILGLPYDNRKTILQTIRFAASTAADHASFFIFVPYPGTRGHKLATENGGNLRIISTDYENIEIQSGGMIELMDAPKRKLEFYQMMGYACFYLRPGKIRNLFKKMSAADLLKTIAGVFTGRW